MKCSRSIGEFHFGHTCRYHVFVSLDLLLISANVYELINVEDYAVHFRRAHTIITLTTTGIEETNVQVHYILTKH